MQQQQHMVLLRMSHCVQAWVSEQGRIDLQYIADRIRTPGEVNGKSANLNNALNHIFPPGTAIGFNEVRTHQVGQRGSLSISRDCLRGGRLQLL